MLKTGVPAAAILAAIFFSLSLQATPVVVDGVMYVAVEAGGGVIALDAEVWSFQTGAGANAPVITYEIKGEQYVAILAGGNRGFQLSAPGDSLWAFKIGGTLAPAAAPPEPPTIEPPRVGGRGGRGAID